MASRDRLEGDAILFVVGIVAVLIFVVYSKLKGFSLPSFPDFGALVDGAVKQIEDWARNIFDVPAIKAFDPNAQPFSGKSGPDWVMTGIGGTPEPSSAEISNGSGLDEYQFSDAELQQSEQQAQQFDNPGTPIDPFAGLPPVQLPQI